MSGVIPEAVAELRDPATIRARCARIAAAVMAGDSRWFTVHEAALAAAAERIAVVTQRNYPDLQVPFHSRWRHFEAGGVDRLAMLDDRLGDASRAQRLAAQLDLAVVSVLLDAGAGPDWRYVAPDRVAYTRSEGLGVASFHAFVDGRFSYSRSEPLQVDAQALCELTAADLQTAFQVAPGNPLVGVEGRVALLQRLGDALARFGGPAARPSDLFARLTGDFSARCLGADQVLGVLLDALSDIWLTPSRLEGFALGDAWPHRHAGGEGASEGWVPFHKLSQWLSYSLLEPLQWAGIEIDGLDRLTALPEYRNGGLLLDSGCLQLRDPALARQTWQVGDELVIEWRALTIHLIDALAPMVRERLGVDAARMPLAALLQGGTWAAGRELAAERRGGLPPLSIDSDGTVF